MPASAVGSGTTAGEDLRGDLVNPDWLAGDTSMTSGVETLAVCSAEEGRASFPLERDGDGDVGL